MSRRSIIAVLTLTFLGFAVLTGTTSCSLNNSGDDSPPFVDPDGITNRIEDLNRDGNYSNDDPNGNGIPAFLDDSE